MNPVYSRVNGRKRKQIEHQKSHFMLRRVRDLFSIDDFVRRPRVCFCLVGGCLVFGLIDPPGMPGGVRALFSAVGTYVFAG